MSIRRRTRGVVTGSLAALVALVAAGNAQGAWSVSIATAPTMGNLTGITLNGTAQTTTTTWNLTGNPFALTSSGNPDGGWNLTVQSNGGAGSAVFKQYCPPASAPCGPDPSGYVTGGHTLPADSLTVNTTGASWTSGGTTPTYQCSASACDVDSPTPVKIVSASTSVLAGTWQTSGSATLSLSTPTTLHKLQANEVYRVNLLWTASTGP